jgi:hypothetical protein
VRLSLAEPPEVEAPFTHRAAPWILGFVAYWLTYAGALAASIPSITPAQALRGAAITLLPEALLAPLVLALVRRTPWEGAKARFVLVHAAGGVLFAALSVGGMAVGFGLEGRLTEGAWRFPAPSLLVWRTIMTLVVFGALASIGHAVAAGRRAREATRRAARAETLRAEAHLAALRAQLEPHFISNLLHSLLGLVSRDPGAAAAGLERLGDLLRYASRVQRQEGELVPLAAELRFVEDYLALERLRLGGRLEVELEVDDAVREVRVPAFVLQPLVENAIRHAAAPRTEGARLRVLAAATNGTLRLAVDDDGPGPGGSTARGEGLGLALVRERLAALYDGAATLAAGPSERGGFLAEVALPLAGPRTEDES